MKNLTDKELKAKIETVFNQLEKNHPIKLGDSSKKTITQAITYFIENMISEEKPEVK